MVCRVDGSQMLCCESDGSITCVRRLHAVWGLLCVIAAVLVCCDPPLLFAALYIRRSHSKNPTKDSASIDVAADARDTATEDAAVVIPRANSSIYDLHSSRKRYIMLLATAFVSIIVPFSDTVYLPALRVSLGATLSIFQLVRRSTASAAAMQCTIAHSSRLRDPVAVSFAYVFGHWCTSIEARRRRASSSSPMCK